MKRRGAIRRLGAGLILFGASLFVITTPAQIQATRTAVSGTCSGGGKSYTDIHANGHVHISDCACPKSGAKYYDKEVDGRLHEYFCGSPTPKPSPSPSSTPTTPNGGVLGITTADPTNGTSDGGSTSGVLGISIPDTGLGSNPVLWFALVLIVAGLMLVVLARVRRSVLADEKIVLGL